MTSLVNTTKSKSGCVICGEVSLTKVFDGELNGRVCQDCVDPLLSADHILTRIKGLKRPDSKIEG